ncbi:hypothetical protein HO173_011306 [Letharia columbiana]|uniref:Uncharacterized protein n=1 Tax=Letharia columbiana TaxID=112416 RepID=A0A8H6FJE8_9LECA|nr:uncharacterized protein HO173_011306 [Letharia columbiana]KAF6229660.1 hypothetical protein HO173_011306 [Letharia columbiana]
MLLSDSLCSSTCAQSTQAMEEQAMQSVRYDGRAGIKMLQVTDRRKSFHMTSGSVRHSTSSA